MIHYETDAERLVYQRTIALVAVLHQLGLDSPADSVIDACEGLALGRRRDSLAGAIQARIDRA